MLGQGKQVKEQGLRGSPGSQGLRGTRSASAVGTFYIYSFDGRLLSEYDIYGTCLRDYIYMGNRLIAEYRPQEGKYYYYTPDQINSTRIVTNDSGAVVYAAAHDPFGGIQKTWTSTYDPVLKFSGKERDAESGLDYFGARYYDKAQYRFISVDPVINAGAAIGNPQRWNLYSYCGNNPIVYLDPDGRSYLIVHKSSNKLEFYLSSGYLVGTFPASNNVVDGCSEFPEGKWDFDHFTPHWEASNDDSISSKGFWGFDVLVDGEWVLNYGIHAGREGMVDSYGNSGWQYVTRGCIRTTEEAMAWIAIVAFCFGDMVTYVIVYAN